jgi:hypothetical protein
MIEYNDCKNLQIDENWVDDLTLNKCSDIKVINSNLKRLKISSSRDIILENLKSLSYLWLYDSCIGSFQFENLKELIVIKCNDIISIPPIKSLIVLGIVDCNNLTELSSLNTSIKNLYCEYCPKLQSIPDTFTELKELDITECPILELPSSLVNLEKISMSRVLITKIPDTFINLYTLFCDRCDNLTFIPTTLRIKTFDFIKCKNLCFTLDR